MGLMRSAVISIAALLLAAAFGIVYADALPNNLQKSICSSNSTKNSSGILNAAQGATEMKNLVGTTNFCTNETVSLVDGPPGLFGIRLHNVLQDQVTCICHSQAEADKVGCDPGETQPTVTTIIPADTSKCVSDKIVISKCVKDAAAAYQAACNQGVDMSQVDSNGNPIHPSTKIASAIPLPGQKPPPTPPADDINNPYGGGSHESGLYTSGAYSWNEYNGSGLGAFSNPYSPTSIGGSAASGALPPPAPIQAPLNNYSVSASPTVTTPAISTAAPVPAVSLLVQPAVASIGTPILVAWSSVGMSAQQPCTMQEGGNALAMKNSGSTVFPTKGLASGTLVFTLSCTSASGSATSRSAMSTIR